MMTATNTSVTIDQLLANIDRAKYNPFEAKRAVFGYLRDVTNGEIDIVDPTSPFIFGLEASTFHNSSFHNTGCVQQHLDAHQQHEKGQQIILKPCK